MRMAEDPRVQNAAIPTMFHSDLHKRNIFVSEEDPTVVSAIIDWQSSSIEPAFWNAKDVPDFAQPVLVPIDGDQTDPKSEACARAFDDCIQLLAPRLSAARSMDGDIFRPFRYCYRTWKDGAAAFREELIQTSRCWKEVGFAEPCPLPLPSSDELTAHQKEYKLFEATQQLKQGLSSLLNTSSDGWVHPEDWEATELAHREVFEALVQQLRDVEQPNDDEPIKSEDDLREIWPFDLKE